jgi:hypothetical protein
MRSRLTPAQSLGFAGFFCGKVDLANFTFRSPFLLHDAAQVIMCLRVREFVAKLLQPHCQVGIDSSSHYQSVATVILGFAVFAVNVLGHFTKNELLIFVSELFQFGMCISLLLLYVGVHIYVSRTFLGEAVAPSFRKRRRLVYMAFAVVEITLVLRAILWLYIAIALHDVAEVRCTLPLWPLSPVPPHTSSASSCIQCLLMHPVPPHTFASELQPLENCR